MTENDAATHYVFRNDPQQLISYVDKHVKIETSEKTIHDGYVYTVDPVTGSYVLVRGSSDERTTVEVIPGHAVKTVLVVEDEAARPSTVIQKLDGQIRNHESRGGTMSDERRDACRRTVTAWLQRHLIPVSSTKDDSHALTIMNALTIVPPYGPEDCFSENEVILGKVQGILKSMPADWKQNE